MADEAQAQDEGDGAVQESSRGPWLKQFVILALLVLIGQIAIAYVLVTYKIMPRYSKEDHAEKSEEVQQKVVRSAVPVTAPLIHDIGEMIVNPEDYATIRFLNVKLSIELDSKKTLDLLKDPIKAAKVQDLVRETLTKTPYSDMDQAEERDALRRKLAAAINASGLLAPGSVANVYFERFVLQ